LRLVVVLEYQVHYLKRLIEQDARKSEIQDPRRDRGGLDMRYLKFAVLLGVMLAVAGTASAQVRVGIGFGVAPVYDGPAYVAPPPACAYGYYGYAPYACAPYGYYGPDYFVGGAFIGTGPWFHGFYGGRGYYGGWHGFNGRGGYYGREGFRGEGFRGEGFRGGAPVRGGGGFHSFAPQRGGGEFHGGGVSHGGGGFHGGGGHGGGHR
jgi:hypothetical protein